MITSSSSHSSSSSGSSCDGSISSNDDSDASSSSSSSSEPDEDVVSNTLSALHLQQDHTLQLQQIDELESIISNTNLGIVARTKAKVELALLKSINSNDETLAAVALRRQEIHSLAQSNAVSQNRKTVEQNVKAQQERIDQETAIYTHLEELNQIALERRTLARQRAEKARLSAAEADAYVKVCEAEVQVAIAQAKEAIRKLNEARARAGKFQREKLEEELKLQEMEQIATNNNSEDATKGEDMFGGFNVKGEIDKLNDEQQRAARLSLLQSQYSPSVSRICIPNLMEENDNGSNNNGQSSEELILGGIHVQSQIDQLNEDEHARLLSQNDEMLLQTQQRLYQRQQNNNTPIPASVGASIISSGGDEGKNKDSMPLISYEDEFQAVLSSNNWLDNKDDDAAVDDDDDNGYSASFEDPPGAKRRGKSIVVQKMPSLRHVTDHDDVTDTDQDNIDVPSVTQYYDPKYWMDKCAKLKEQIETQTVESTTLSSRQASKIASLEKHMELTGVSQQYYEEQSSKLSKELNVIKRTHTKQQTGLQTLQNQMNQYHAQTHYLQKEIVDLQDMKQLLETKLQHVQEEEKAKLQELNEEIDSILFQREAALETVRLTVIRYEKSIAEQEDIIAELEEDVEVHSAELQRAKSLLVKANNSPGSSRGKSLLGSAFSGGLGKKQLSACELALISILEEEKEG